MNGEIEEVIEDARHEFKWNGKFMDKTNSALSRYGIIPSVLELEWHRKAWLNHHHNEHVLNHLRIANGDVES